MDRDSIKIELKFLKGGKIVAKKINLTLFLLALILLVVTTVNGVFAYFSSNASAEGSNNFASLGVTLAYHKIDETNVNNYTAIDSSTGLVVYPVGGNINRGEKFKIATEPNKTEADAVAISFRLDPLAIESYARIWVEAYLTTDTNKTTDYGQYFLLYAKGEDGSVEIADKSINGNLATYYLTTSANTSSSNYSNKFIFYEVQLDKNAPAELLGGDVTINISYDMCQKANKAYLSVFDDERGYSSDWS